MPRQRMVKPEFFDSENLGMCSIASRLLFIGIWVMGDDYGNQKAQLSKLRNRVFPYDSMSHASFLDLLCELEEVGCIKGYVVDGERYINVPNFKVYQTVRKPSATVVPEPPEDTVNAKRTDMFHQWRTSGAPVCNEGGDALVTHQYATSDPERKKEGRNRSLTTSIPNESDPAGADAAGAAPPGSPGPSCPMCHSPVEKTGMPDPDYWWCGNCRESLAKNKAI